MLKAGHSLRAIRRKLGLTLKDVEDASHRIARRHRNEEFAIPPSRLSDFETKGVIPSVYRLYSLAVIYRQDPHGILSLYGVDFLHAGPDLSLPLAGKSHPSNALPNSAVIEMPIRLDPSFDLRRTAKLGHMVQQWGFVPLAYLSHFTNREYTYGYIGSEDLTMYPILPPGTFVQVDESKNRVVEGVWRSEYERPIYFVETREGHVCCWCALKRDTIVLQPHPLSPVPIRILKHPQEAEVLGQVVGMALRMGDSLELESSMDSPGQTALS